MEYTLQIENVYSYLSTNDLVLKNTLYKAMRWRKANFYYPAFRQQNWDGYTNFFDNKTGKFLTGLLPEIEFALKKFNINYKVNDLRQDFIFIYKSIDKNFLDGIELYDYQVDLINHVLKYKRGIIKAPTGSGKTNVLVSIVKSLPPNTPTLILTDTKDLVEQNYQDLLKHNIANLGVYHSENRSPNIITCCTTQSLKKFEKILNKIKVVIVDEIHACVSAVPIKYYKKMANASVRVGISATPYSKCNVQKYIVKGYFGAIAKTKATESGYLTTKELQERGILSDSNCTFFEIDQPQIPYAIYQDAVKDGIADNSYLHKKVAKLAKKCKGRTLILVERLEQGDKIAKLIPNVFWIQGKDNQETRKEVIQKLKTSESVIAIISQKIVSKGLDVKIHNLINVAGGKSQENMIQRLGRGLRLAGDKDMFNYYDFLFNISDYLRNHSEERIKCLKKEGHYIVIKDADEI